MNSLLKLVKPFGGASFPFSLFGWHSLGSMDVVEQMKSDALSKANHALFRICMNPVRGPCRYGSRGLHGGRGLFVAETAKSVKNCWGV